MELHISNGNTKLGAVMNTSFPPVITCRKNAPCASDGCYALKFYRMYPSCHKAWDENLKLYKKHREQYWRELCEAVRGQRYFRYFVSGDIPDENYFVDMISLAKGLPKTEFLCFTKQFEIVNKVMDAMTEEGCTFPENLHLLFSGWEGLEVDNPYGFPTTEVITKDMAEIPEDWLICGGNCTECACRGVGCWQVKPGQVIAFHKH